MCPWKAKSVFEICFNDEQFGFKAIKQYVLKLIEKNHLVKGFKINFSTFYVYGILK